MGEIMSDAYEDRPTRLCMSCGQSDKAPRDVVALPDGNTALYHKDCHSMLGCVVCKEELEAVANGSGSKGKKNEDLLNAILKQSKMDWDSRHSVYTRDDVTGGYQKAIDEGRIVDTTWEAGRQ